MTVQSCPKLNWLKILWREAKSWLVGFQLKSVNLEFSFIRVRQAQSFGCACLKCICDLGKNYFFRKIKKSLFLPYFWYGKVIFFVEKWHVSGWPRILIWPN